jgi:hypothetical protein
MSPTVMVDELEITGAAYAIFKLKSERAVAIEKTAILRRFDLIEVILNTIILRALSIADVDAETHHLRADFLMSISIKV